MIKTKHFAARSLLAAVLTVSLLASPASVGFAGAQTATPSPAETPKPAETAKPDAAKEPSRAELGAMLKKCSDEADAKGLTVQKGKSEARKSFRRTCMLKNGVAPKRK